MTSSPLTALADAVIFTGEAFVENHALLLQDGFVADIVANARVPTTARKVDCREQILAPGFVDCQVNGGGNLLFNASPTAETALAIAKAHAHYGTTSLLLTCISDTPAIMRQALEAVRVARRQDKGILGIHFEGPHLSVEKRGVHHAGFLRDITEDDIALYRPDGDEIILVTLAPERVTTEQIQRLMEQGTKVSLGHTAATAEQTRAALKAGASGFTHLFNAMPPLSARADGPAGIALDDRDSWCGIIVDGQHVSDEMIRLAERAKPPGKLFFVSDAMPPAATPTPQDFQLYEKHHHYAKGRCFTEDNRLAGSAVTMAESVRLGVTRVGFDPAEVLKMASANPAAFLGKEKLCGSLLLNRRGSVVALDEAFRLRHVWHHEL